MTEGRPCKLCGMHIIVAESVTTGVQIALQRVSAIYRIDGHGPLFGRAEKVIIEGGKYVPHTDTCSGIEKKVGRKT